MVGERDICISVMYSCESHFTFTYSTHARVIHMIYSLVKIVAHVVPGRSGAKNPGTRS